MLKQSHTTTTATRSIASSKRSNLYDRVRQDLFEDDDTRHHSRRTKINTPSITTICLLQIQAYIIQILTRLPTWTAKKSPRHRPLSIYYYLQQKKLHTTSLLKSFLIHCLRWVLLIVLLLLDNMARLLNVEREMAHITRQLNVEDDHDPCGSSEPSSPANSPTPNFLVRKPSHSPVFNPAPAHVGHGHVLSLSNNMINQKQPTSPQKLRRITARRDISMENGISPKKSSDNHDHRHHHHHHRTSKKPPVSNSVASLSSSESSTLIKETHDKPRMQKSVSLSTAQQYHKEECSNSNSNSKKSTKRPYYERCCSACSTF